MIHQIRRKFISNAKAKKVGKTRFTFNSYLALSFAKVSRWLKGNVIKNVRSMGSNYSAAYVGGEKIKADGLKWHTRTDVITH